MTKIYLSIPMNVNGDEISEMPALLVTLDLAAVRDMIHRVRKVRAMHAEDDWMFSLTRHGFAPIVEVYDRCRVDLENLDLFDECSVELTEEQHAQIEAKVDQGTTIDLENPGAAIKADNRLENYITDGVYFTATVKYTSVTLESQGIGLDDLLAYRKRLSKEG